MEKSSKRFEMVTPAGWLERIDEWRRQQPDIPTRAEAIRRLVEQGLDASIARHPVRDHVGSRTFHQDPEAYGNAPRKRN